MSTFTSLACREARREDIPILMEIRNGVRENQLVSMVLTERDYERALFEEGRGWVCEIDAQLVGFCCGRPKQGDVWALFVRESFEARGAGSALMSLVEDWMFNQGLSEIWLRTAAETRAERLYRKRGWRASGILDSGEIEFRLQPRQARP